MTQEIRTITIGAGQARPRRRSQKHTRRRVRLNGWTVAKYAALTVAGGPAVSSGCGLRPDRTGI